MRSLDIKPITIKNKKGVGLKAVQRTAVTPQKTWPKVVGFLVVLLILFAVLFALYVLPEARIQITPGTEPITRDFEVRVDKNQETPNPSELAIRGKLFEEEISGSKTYSSTGSKNIGHTASGFVHIYNFSKTTLILRKDTTVLTAGNKKYFFTQDVGNIRPTALIGLEEQEVDPSSLIPPVPVVAAGSGEQYNLPVGVRLEIENEVLGKQPKVLYAVVAENISGGTTKEVRVVTEADLNSAYSALAKELVSNSRSKLVAQDPESRLLDSGLVTAILEQKSSVAADTESAEFEAYVKIKLRALFYNEKDLRSVITQRIKRLLPENKVLKEDKGFSRLQSNFLNINYDQGLGILSNHYEGTIVYQVDTAELLEKVKNKTPEEIREILLSRPEIAAVKIKFYPFWVKKAPKFTKKIYLEIMETSEKFTT